MKDKLASIRTENLMVNGKTIDNDITLNKNIKDFNLLFFEFVSMYGVFWFFGP
jgi:hypothetical protein